MIYTNKGYYKWNNKNYKFNYLINLPISKKVEFVNFNKEIVIYKSNYVSLLRDIIFNYSLIIYFTNIDKKIFEDKNGNIELDSIESFINNTKVIEILKSNINTKLLNELNNSVDNSIAYSTGIYKDNISLSIIELIKSIKNYINTIEKKFENIDLNSIENFSKLGKEIADLKSDKVLDVIVKEIHNTNNIKEE